MEADQAFEQALKHGIGGMEAGLLNELGQALIDRGKLAAAEGAFRRSLQPAVLATRSGGAETRPMSPASQVTENTAAHQRRILLAETLAAQHSFEEALQQ